MEGEYLPLTEITENPMIPLAILLTTITLGAIAQRIISDNNILTMEQKINRLKSIVADERGVTVEKMLSKSRKRNLVESRQICHWLMANRVIDNDLTLGDIGKHIGKVDHSTVLHSRRAIEKLSSVDPELRERVVKLGRTLGRSAKWMEEKLKESVNQQALF